MSENQTVKPVAEAPVAEAPVAEAPVAEAPVAEAPVAEAPTPDEKNGPGELLDSPPVLQNPSSQGVTVAWAVSAPATGWVEYGPTPELGQRADGAVYGQNPFSARFFSVRLSGLKPGQTLYYRVVAAPVRFGGDSQVERGLPVFGPIYRWTSLNAEADQATFVVINDTHEQTEIVQALMERIAEKPDDLTIWNGDVFNFVDSEAQIVAQVLHPAGTAYAAEQPVMFIGGNHDVRGHQARALSQATTVWENEAPMGRCFAVRQGPLAIIGLDTGEDKPDRHPSFAGLANFEPYRQAQRDWLASVLRREEIAAAPYLIVFCHFPLWGLPGHNPGDTLEGYGHYCRHAQQLWHPLLEAADAQVVISGHMHKLRYDDPTDEHRYGQLVGGGPKLEKATIIRGHADSSRLEITATDLNQNQLGQWRFSPRTIS